MGGAGPTEALSPGLWPLNGEKQKQRRGRGWHTPVVAGWDFQLGPASVPKTSLAPFLCRLDSSSFLFIMGCYCSVAKSWPTLCDPMDCSLPGFSVLEISQARTLEWVAISFSRGSSWPRDWTHVLYTGRWIFYHWATCGDLCYGRDSYPSNGFPLWQGQWLLLNQHSTKSLLSEALRALRPTPYLEDSCGSLSTQAAELCSTIFTSYSQVSPQWSQNESDGGRELPAVTVSTLMEEVNHHMISHICGIRSRLMDTEQTCGCQGRSGEEGVDRRLGISRRQPPHLEWINCKVLTGNCIQ